MATIIDGKAIAEKIKGEIARQVEQMLKRGMRAPHLAAILVGVLLVLPSITATNRSFAIIPSSHSCMFLLPTIAFSIISIILETVSFMEICAGIQLFYQVRTTDSCQLMLNIAPLLRLIPEEKLPLCKLFTLCFG